MVEKPEIVPYQKIEIVPKIETLELIKEKLAIQENTTQIIKPVPEIHHHNVEVLIQHWKDVIVEEIVKLKPDQIKEFIEIPPTIIDKLVPEIRYQEKEIVKNIPCKERE